MSKKVKQKKEKEKEKKGKMSKKKQWSLLYKGGGKLIPCG